MLTEHVGGGTALPLNEIIEIVRIYRQEPKDGIDSNNSLSRDISNPEIVPTNQNVPIPTIPAPIKEADEKNEQDDNEEDEYEYEYEEEKNEEGKNEEPVPGDKNSVGPSD